MGPQRSFVLSGNGRRCVGIWYLYFLFSFLVASIVLNRPSNLSNHVFFFFACIQTKMPIQSVLSTQRYFFRILRVETNIYAKQAKEVNGKILQSLVSFKFFLASLLLCNDDCSHRSHWNFAFECCPQVTYSMCCGKGQQGSILSIFALLLNPRQGCLNDKRQPRSFNKFH